MDTFCGQHRSIVDPVTSCKLRNQTKREINNFSALVSATMNQKYLKNYLNYLETQATDNNVVWILEHVPGGCIEVEFSLN